MDEMLEDTLALLVSDCEGLEDFLETKAGTGYVYAFEIVDNIIIAYVTFIIPLLIDHLKKPGVEIRIQPKSGGKYTVSYTYAHFKSFTLILRGDVSGSELLDLLDSQNFKVITYNKTKD